jgi:ribosomal protein S18 acetylase RimI-like enzyme
MLLAHYEPQEREARRQGLLCALDDGVLCPDGLLVLPGLTGLAGAILAAPVPGAGGAIWPPAVTGLTARGQTAAALVGAAWSWLRQRGARVIQALLGPGQAPRAQLLLDNGFRHVTSLITFTHSLRLDAAGLTEPWHLVLEPYDEGRPAEMHEVLQRTYEGSLDCPEVNGLRTIEEVVAGHREQGVYDPANWWLARHQGRGVAVLLQHDDASGEAREVAYVGVVPEARRRGHGRELVLRALLEARAAGKSSLALSVDARNRPAWQLYESLGFEEALRQQVLLRLE